jgi:hypothetical protein
MNIKQFRKQYNGSDLVNRILLLQSYVEQHVGPLPSLPLKKISSLSKSLTVSK